MLPHHIPDRRVPVESAATLSLSMPRIGSDPFSLMARGMARHEIAAVYDPAGQLQRPLWDVFGAGDSTANPH